MVDTVEDKTGTTSQRNRAEFERWLDSQMQMLRRADKCHTARYSVNVGGDWFEYELHAEFHHGVEIRFKDVIMAGTFRSERLGKHIAVCDPFFLACHRYLKTPEYE